MPHFDWMTGFVYPYINFFIFFGVLVFLVRRPAASFAKKRREDFLSIFQKNQSAFKEAQDHLSVLKERLGALDGELSEIREQGEETSRIEVEKIQKEGEAIVRSMSLDFDSFCQQELRKAKEQLFDEVSQALQQSLTKHLTTLSEEQASKQFQGALKRFDGATEDAKGVRS